MSHLNSFSMKLCQVLSSLPSSFFISIHCSIGIDSGLFSTMNFSTSSKRPSSRSLKRSRRNLSFDRGTLNRFGSGIRPVILHSSIRDFKMSMVEISRLFTSLISPSANDLSSKVSSITSLMTSSSRFPNCLTYRIRPGRPIRLSSSVSSFVVRMYSFLRLLYTPSIIFSKISDSSSKVFSASSMRTAASKLSAWMNSSNPSTGFETTMVGNPSLLQSCLAAMVLPVPFNPLKMTPRFLPDFWNTSEFHVWIIWSLMAFPSVPYTLKLTMKDSAIFSRPMRPVLAST